MIDKGPNRAIIGSLYRILRSSRLTRNPIQKLCLLHKAVVPVQLAVHFQGSHCGVAHSFDYNRVRSTVRWITFAGDAEHIVMSIALLLLSFMNRAPASPVHILAFKPSTGSRLKSLKSDTVRLLGATVLLPPSRSLHYESVSCQSPVISACVFWVANRALPLRGAVLDSGGRQGFYCWYIF